MFRRRIPDQARLTPSTTPSMDYKAFANAMPPDDLAQAHHGPWVPVEYKTDELLIMRRNPYFWKVDEEGNQLPYIDEAVYQKGPAGVGRTLCTWPVVATTPTWRTRPASMWRH